MAVEGIITLGIGSAPGGLFPFLTLGLTANAGAAATPLVTRMVGLNFNPSDVLSLASNPSDTLSLNSNPSDTLSVDA